MKSQSQYKLSQPAKAAFLKWWHAINSDTAGGASRADRASLKRAHDLTAVSCASAYQRVYREMLVGNDGSVWPAFQQERIAALVGLAVHVKTKSSRTLPEAMSNRVEGSGNPVSELRFARILNSPDVESLFAGLRRCLPLINHEVDPVSLADDVFEWGDIVKKRWAYAYRWPEKAGA